MKLLNPQAQQFIQALRSQLPQLVVMASKTENTIEWVEVRYNWLWEGADEYKKSEVQRALSLIGTWANEFTLVMESDVLNTKIPLEISNDEIYPSGYFQAEKLSLSLRFEFGVDSQEPLGDIPQLAKVSRGIIERTVRLVQQTLQNLEPLTNQ